MLKHENKRFQEAPNKRKAKFSEQEGNKISERIKKYWVYRKARNAHKQIIDLTRF